MTENPSFLEPLVEGKSVAVPLDVFPPEQVLRSLNGHALPVRVTIEDRDATLALDVGNGFVMGAEREGGSAADALERFLGMEGGVAEVAPTRFLQLANLICPIEKVLGEKCAYVTKTLRVNPTVPREIPLKDPDPARDAECDRWSFASSDEVEEAEPESSRRSVRELSETDIVLPESGGRWTTWVIAAACLLALAVGAIGGLWAADADAAGPVQREKAVGIGPLDTSPRAPAVEPEAGPVAPAAVADADALAATYVSRIRRLMRAGERVEALQLAERAVLESPGHREVQLVLGDTRFANGQRAGARRAWRRALRLSPGWRAAARRLERHGERSAAAADPVRRAG
jgi:hypothetical protein